MEYDYYGFPEHTYHIKYPAPGSPTLAKRVKDLLSTSGIHTKEDAQHGFDHGVFVPLELMYPQADVPVVMLSLKSGDDVEEHIRVGQALAPLRDEGVLIVDSGLTYHNMRGFGRAVDALGLGPGTACKASTGYFCRNLLTCSAGACSQDTYLSGRRITTMRFSSSAS